MSLLTKILVPLDGSKLAEEALTAVEETLPKEHLIVIVTTVDPAVTRTFEDFAHAEQISVYEAIERYQSDVVAALGTRGVKARAVFMVDPDAADGVLRAAREEQPTLIVMSSHGRSGLRKLMLGSVAERILKEVECPILIVPMR